jgi:hypothetical protein
MASDLAVAGPYAGMAPSPAPSYFERSPTVAFREHPGAAIITSFPGLSDVPDARILGEIGRTASSSPARG